MVPNKVERTNFEEGWKNTTTLDKKARGEPVQNFVSFLDLQEQIGPPPIAGNSTLASPGKGARRYTPIEKEGNRGFTTPPPPSVLKVVLAAISPVGKE